MKTISVLLADIHTVVRQGLRVLLEVEGDMKVVGEAQTGREAVLLAKKLKPDVVVLDVAMPVLNGLEATRQICRSVPAIKVLILSWYSDQEYVEQLIEAGAIGYLIKQTAANDLLKAIREAVKGNAFFSPAISRRLVDRCREAFRERRPGKEDASPPDLPGKRSSPTHCGRAPQQTNRGRTEHQHQNCREASPASHE